MCKRAFPPANVVRFVADPDVLVRTVGQRRSPGRGKEVERKKERKGRKVLTCSLAQPMRTDGLKAERECDNGERGGIEK